MVSSAGEVTCALNTVLARKLYFARRRIFLRRRVFCAANIASARRRSSRSRTSFLQDDMVCCRKRRSRAKVHFPYLEHHFRTKCSSCAAACTSHHKTCFCIAARFSRLHPSLSAETHFSIYLSSRDSNTILCFRRILCCLPIRYTAAHEYERDHTSRIR